MAAQTRADACCLQYFSISRSTAESVCRPSLVSLSFARQQHRSTASLSTEHASLQQIPVKKAQKTSTQLLDSMANSTADEAPQSEWVPPKRRPMIEPIRSPRHLAISDSDFAKLKVGFKPSCMEHRWVMQVTDADAYPDPDREDTILVHISRSWTYFEFYTLHARQGDDGATIESITWERRQGEAIWEEGKSKIEAVSLIRGILDCKIEGFPRTVWSNEACQVVIAPDCPEEGLQSVDAGSGQQPTEAKSASG